MLLTISNNLPWNRALLLIPFLQVNYRLQIQISWPNRRHKHSHKSIWYFWVSLWVKFTKQVKRPCVGQLDMGVLNNKSMGSICQKNVIDLEPFFLPHPTQIGVQFNDTFLLKHIVIHSQVREDLQCIEILHCNGTAEC